MSFITATGTTGIGEGVALAGGMGALGSIGSALIGSSAAGNAAQQATTGENAALMAGIGGQESATNALGPYYTGGLSDYDTLQYLLTGNANPGNVQPLTPDQQAQMAQLQDYINTYSSTRGGQSGKYGAALENAQAQLAQLQNQQQAYQATQGAAQAGNATGLGAGGLLNIPQFSYNPNTDTGLQNASSFANNVIASQNAAAGGYGSGNMASSIATELAGTLEPQYYNQAFQNYDVNQIQPRQMIYNMLTGNTGGAGQQVATNLGNLYTGQAANAQNLLGQIGQDQAAGTMGQANAWSNALNGIGTQANSLLGMGMQYQNQQGIQNILAQLAKNQGGSGTNLFNDPYGTGSGQFSLLDNPSNPLGLP